ncbi:hypothetical protein S40285_05314 [Stachybotrys chlorohalonatus IBT 40285]|uniref:DUF7728 domain-containing protein n=1 Tax=Stachybotrys chlorohalonatus (strain IBT 40285) TaxID=1283841 RepID=A0A084QS35_STAC4|nr:hypothetical protein S40285_05314 [Stachybotrys chlorohalonata IBT 40285]
MKSDSLLKPLLFTATAAAFLIPGELTSPDGEIFEALPVHADTIGLPPTAFAQSIEVPCRHCKGRGTSLRLDIAVEDASRLTLNGFELYPNADPWRGDLTASVVAHNGREREERLGYSLAVTPVGMDGEQQMEVVGIHLRVIEVGNRFMQDIPAIDMKLIKAPNSEILIGAIDILEERDSQCQSLWCRATKMLSGTFHGGCSKAHRRPSHAGHGEADHRMHKDGRPKHHHHHGHHRNWRQLFKNVATQIFLPGLAGLVAGIGVAIIATILCTFVVHFVRIVRRGRQGGSMCPARRQRTRVTEVAIAEEKVGLMEQDDERSSIELAAEKQ